MPGSNEAGQGRAAAKFSWAETLWAFRENSAEHKTNIGGPLAKPAHEGGEPLTPERDVHAYVVSLRHHFRLKELL